MRLFPDKSASRGFGTWFGIVWTMKITCSNVLRRASKNSRHFLLRDAELPTSKRDKGSIGFWED
jgi:hypothetical protein